MKYMTPEDRVEVEQKELRRRLRWPLAAMAVFLVAFVSAWIADAVHSRALGIAAWVVAVAAVVGAGIQVIGIFVWLGQRIVRGYRE